MMSCRHTLRLYHHKRGLGWPFVKVHTSREGRMKLQLGPMALVHCNNSPIIHPQNWLPLVKNSRLFAQCAHSARCTSLESKS